MKSPMMRVRYVNVRAGRAALTALMLSALPLAAVAQAPGAGQASAPAPSAAPAPPPRNMSESVAAVVNDQIISTYDLAQRMRLLIATSGVQPTEQTLPRFQREALISLVDERLQ